MQNKKIWLGASAAVIILIVAVMLISHHNQNKSVKGQGEPELTAEQILAERSHQASKLLETPLGKAFVDRNWAEVSKLYQPNKDFVKLGEIIRSLYIERAVEKYTSTDQQQLMTLVLNTFQNMQEKDFHLAGMLASQFERLPAPKHDDANFKTLKAWALDPNEAGIKRKLGVIKLALHDASPDPQIMSFYQKLALGGDPIGQTHIEWVQRVDEIRNVKAQESTLDAILKNFKKIPDEAQASALTVLAHHTELFPKDIKVLTLKFLHSENQGKYEAALRALPPLIDGKWLKDSDKKEVVKTLTDTSARLKTPFVEIKTKEILGLLEHT